MTDPTTRRDFDGLSLLPAATVAFGAAARSDERLISVQAGIGRLIALICNVRLPSLHLPRSTQAPQFLRTFF